MRLIFMEVEIFLQDFVTFCRIWHELSAITGRRNVLQICTVSNSSVAEGRMCEAALTLALFSPGC
jgi:hypothetical protein